MKRTARYYRKMSERLADVDYSLAESLRTMARTTRSQSGQRDRAKRMREVGP